MKNTFTYDPSVDYFESYELLPNKVYNIITQAGELEDYKDTLGLQEKLESIGWTFDFYLDNTPYDLRPINSRSVQDVINAEINLEPLACVHCGSHEVTYHQYIGDAHCSECGEWQTE